MATTALEVEWYGDGTFAGKGWTDLDVVIDRAMAISRVRELDLRGFEAVWKVRDKDGGETHFLIPRRREGDSPGSPGAGGE